MNYERDPRPNWDARWFIHALLTGILFALAVQLFQPGSTYGAGGASGEPAGNWRIIALYMSERTLAGLLWAAACVGAVGLFTVDRRVRLGSVLALSAVHAMLAFAFALSNPNGAGAILLAGYAVAGGYLAYRRTAEGL